MLLVFSHIDSFIPLRVKPLRKIMRPYSVAEDNIILEAALIAGVHRSRGKHGGLHKVLRKFLKTHRTVRNSRGLAVARTAGSLKMRLYRIYSTGVMKWGLSYEKKHVFRKQRCPLRNIGTFEQKKTREYLIKVMFNEHDYTMSGIPTVETKKGEEAVSHQAHQAVAAARNARRARRAAAKENESRIEPCSDIERAAAEEIESSTEPYSAIARAAAKEIEIESSTEPCSAIAHPHESNSFPTLVQQIDKPGEVVPYRNVEGGKGKMSTYQIYKENLKTIRELAAMRQETLQFMRREYESHVDFLKKTIAELAEQQKYILRMMGTEAKRN